MKRQIIKIDETLCDGCGLCATGCPEGAIQIVDGKARLVGEILCDGLGACIGECPVGAISIEEREAEPYDERKVVANIIQQGPAVLEAHLLHLKSHRQDEYLRIAREELGKLGVADPTAAEREEACGCGGKGPGHGGGHGHGMGQGMGHGGGPGHGMGHGMGHGPAMRPQASLHVGVHGGGGCPGSRNAVFARGEAGAEAHPALAARSELTHWPVQLHLMSPMAPQYSGADVVLAADCVAFALGDFHGRFLKGKALAIACPKLDDGQDEYEQKITALVDQAQINTLSVIIMEVPCCRGLLRLAQSALAKATRKVPVKAIVVGISGDIVAEQWI